DLRHPRKPGPGDTEQLLPAADAAPRLRGRRGRHGQGERRDAGDGVMKRGRRECGQSLVLAALLITALTGFVGLAVDGGEAANEQQIVRSAADGAALAGAYSIGKGSTIA